MHVVLRLTGRVGGSVLVALSLLLVLTVPAAAEDAAAPQAESTDLIQASGMSSGTLFWGVAGVGALIVGWAMTRRPRGIRTPDQVLAAD